MCRAISRFIVLQRSALERRALKSSGGARLALEGPMLQRWPLDCSERCRKLDGCRSQVAARYLRTRTGAGSDLV